MNALDVLREYAQNTGAFRVNNEAAAKLAETCAAVVELVEAADELPIEYDYHGNPASPEWQGFLAALAHVQGVQS